MRVFLGVFSAAIALVACGGDQPAATSITPVPPTSTTTTAIPETTVTVAPATSTTLPDVTTTTVPPIDVEFSEGQMSGVDVIEVDLGDAVDIWVLSDVDDELHVHGYDLYFDLAADEPLHLDFVADVPGIFEVEIHTGHTLLFELRVAG